MKVLAVHPSGLMYTRVFLRLEPLGLELVAAACQSAGHAVRLIDLQVEPQRDFFRTLNEWRPAAICFSIQALIRNDRPVTTSPRPIFRSGVRVNTRLIAG